MIVVVTAAQSIPNELKWINDLLRVGLEKMHIRKPEFSEEELFQFVQRINNKYADRLVVHGHHQLISRLPHVNFHHKSMGRKKVLGQYSTSVHSQGELSTYVPFYRYLFCSPVFDSISKKGYTSNMEWQQQVVVEYADKIIALGGIDRSKLLKLKEWNYKHIALLGAIWNAENPVEAFEKIRMVWEREA